jgi:uncharacterized membrane protein YphA (DoxX/SURF4 family)
MAPPEQGSTPGHLWPRWIVLRAMGIWFFSVFYSLWFQACGLLGDDGILPAKELLAHVRESSSTTTWAQRLWETPTFLWLGTSDRAIHALCACGLAGSALLFLNLAPRWAAFVCALAFLSFGATLQRFSSYQSDGMLMEAGLLSVFFAPPGLRPRLAPESPPSRLSLFALQWLWFRIYFESGVAKIRSHDPDWRGLTAMDHYYENGPLPTWIGWYVQQTLPHWFHAGVSLLTLLAELLFVLGLFLTRAVRIGLFWVLTCFQAGIILTANYAFLNYLVLSLGFLLLDDRYLAKFRVLVPHAEPRQQLAGAWIPAGVLLSWQVYATTLPLLDGMGGLFPPENRESWRNAIGLLPRQPLEVLSKHRFAGGYGLFARMTHDRYELEFEGSNDGEHWKIYHYRYKPQNPRDPPGIYAPYQPRFEWNLWFASLGEWQSNQWVLTAASKLLTGSRDVLELFREDPFHGQPPSRVRVVRWKYWFSTPEEKKASGVYWDRVRAGSYGPVLEREADGRVVAEAQ